MTAPQIPAAWGQPAPAPAPQPQYAPPPQQPQYQQPAQPYAPPQGYQAPPPQYAPQPQYGAPQYAPPMNGYGAPMQYGPPQPPPVPTAQPESLDDYLNQQQGGQNFWKWDNPGDCRIGVIAREISKHDVRHKTFQGNPVNRRDGSPIWELQLPLLNQDGTEGVWGVSGRDKTALENAVRAAGGPENGIPPAGAALRVTFTHRPTHKGPDWSGQGAPPKIKSVECFLGNGQAPVPVVQQQQQQPQAPVSQPIPAQQYAAPAQQMAPPPQQQYQQPEPQQQMAPPPQQYGAPAPQQYAAPQQMAPPAQGAPPQLDPNAQAQFAHLLGGAAPAQ